MSEQPAGSVPSGGSAEQESANAGKKDAKKPEKKELKEYSMEEIAKHDKESDLWVAVNGQVLDVTDFANRHPGGKPALLLYAGKEASEEFNMLHEANVVEKYSPDSIIGTYKQEKKDE